MAGKAKAKAAAPKKAPEKAPKKTAPANPAKPTEKKPVKKAPKKGLHIVSVEAAGDRLIAVVLQAGGVIKEIEVTAESLWNKA